MAKARWLGRICGPWGVNNQGINDGQLISLRTFDVSFATSTKSGMRDHCADVLYFVIIRIWKEKYDPPK